MSLEGKEEKLVTEMVYCAGIKKMLKVEGCSDECDHYYGTHREPIKRRNDDGSTEIIGENAWVKCKYPKFEKITKLYEVS